MNIHFAQTKYSSPLFSSKWKSIFINNGGVTRLELVDRFFRQTRCRGYPCLPVGSVIVGERQHKLAL